MNILFFSWISFFFSFLFIFGDVGRVWEITKKKVVKKKEKGKEKKKILEEKKKINFLAFPKQNSFI